ncbi:isochorismatase family cysteine hydrolase [Piscinibacter sp. XHJ-5]|uniref:cysteine hydrolase family protein n=1 Tax=Piscinibacter sp. XHJ-5 TaxID=3037797 RepID=UPI002452D0B0|nr:isochorismatase family cysteine hydrolase [Piscinibacter sp. XHJ-5]
MPSRPKPRNALAGRDAAGGCALLIVDMISDWRFADADKLLPPAAAIAPPIAAFKRRCRRAGVPVIYANDNRGQWRSDFRDVVAGSLAVGGDGAGITQLLLPHEDDYFVLKPKHSAFFGTPLDLLLQHLKAVKLFVTGAASDQCVVTTAVAARMHDYEVLVPRDCVASQSDERNRRAIEHFEQALDIRTTPSRRIRLPRSS